MRIDTHMHLYANADEGLYDVNTYPIVEYGQMEGVRFSDRAGTVQDGLDALAEAGMQYGAVLGSYELPELPHPPEGARHWPEQPPYADHADALVEYNRWLCSLQDAHPELLPFITVNPAVMTGAQSAAHVDELIRERGARGMKLHTIAIRVFPDDPGMQATFGVAQEAQLPIVVHCGPDIRGYGWATPGAFAGLAERFPRLPLILAHLGGAAWRDIAAVAEAHPQLHFDLSEIVQWAGAPLGAKAEELSELIRGIGAHRVLLGSDFPWYEPKDTVAALESLPGLGREEKDAILGDNAARMLRLV